MGFWDSKRIWLLNLENHQRAVYDKRVESKWMLSPVHLETFIKQPFYKSDICCWALCPLSRGYLQLRRNECEVKKSEANQRWDSSSLFLKKSNGWFTLTDRGCAKEFKELFRGVLLVRSHSSRVVNMPVAPRATADQRQGREIEQTPQQDTAMPSQHARFLTPLLQNIKTWPQGYTGETVGGKTLRKRLPSCTAHRQPRGSSQPGTALTS